MATVLQPRCFFPRSKARTSKKGKTGGMVLFHKVATQNDFKAHYGAGGEGGAAVTDDKYQYHRMYNDRNKCWVRDAVPNTTVPQVPNRLLLFRSYLFHTSDRIHFREDYGNERWVLVFTSTLEKQDAGLNMGLMRFDRADVK